MLTVGEDYKFQIPEPKPGEPEWKPIIRYLVSKMDPSEIKTFYELFPNF